MKILKFLIIGVLAINLFSFGFASDSTDDSWTLIPKATDSMDSWRVEDLGNKDLVGGKKADSIWLKYNVYAKKMSVGDAFATGIFSWDTIFAFFKHIAKVLSEMGLVIGAGMIIYAGYKYATGVFTGDASKGGKDAIKGAIYGLLIVIFSYAIMRILLAMFW